MDSMEVIHIFHLICHSSGMMQKLMQKLMQELMQENAGLQKVGERRWARYEYSNAREH